MEERTAELGFEPQKETPYNTLLPYADRLDAESNEQLAQIKAHLARTVQLRDLKIGASHWTGQLAKYIRLYGHKFSKEDHLTFIKILFELITIPDLDYSLIQKFSQLLVTLLKKRVLLSREDLVLPWRPLYKLLDNSAYSRYEHHGLVLLPTNIENVLKNLIRVCRIYFHEDATQEILDEFRPLMCPFDITMIRATFFFELLLPTNLPPESHHKGFKLWLGEFIGIWESCQNNPSWEGSLVQLFARLANGNIGYVDWEPYLPQIFTRILRSFNVPVGSSRIQVSRNNTTYDVSQICWWIVAMMGGQSSVQTYLNRMFKALESFYHPSNIGKWHTKLNRLMCRLPYSLVRRVHKERYKKTWESPVPDSHKLSDDEITAFVESMKPVVFLAMFSKIGSHDSAAAFQHLSVLRPELIIPSLLEKTYPALETLTEPHRLIACLHCTVAVGRTMLGSPERYPEGRMHVLPLLNFSLPGIDPNDIKKCLITFQLVSTLVSLVPLVDCSGAVHCRTDLTEEDRELCSATAQFEDFVLQFLDRVIALIENSAQEHTRTDSARPDRLTHEEMMLEVGLLSTYSVIVQQSSTQIFEESLRRLFRFISTSFMEIRVAGKFTADLLRSMVKARPEIALKTFINHFCDILKARMSSEDLSKEEHLDNEILWNLKLLSEAVRCDGSCLLAYGEQLVDVLKATLHLKCKEAADLAGNLLHHLLRALTLIYALDHRSTTMDWNKPLTEVLPIREWGVPGYLYNLQLKWHIPTKEEKEFTAEILETFLLPELARVRKHISQEEVMSREELLQCLSIIQHCLVGAGSRLPMWTGESIKLIDSLIDLTRYSTSAAVSDEGISLNGENVRAMVASTVRPLLEHMLKTSEDDTKSLQGIIKVYHSLLFYHGTQKEEFDGRWKSLHIVKKSLENKLLGKKHHIRALLVDRAQLQHELRVVQKCAKIFTPLHKDLFGDLFRLSVSRYSEVRKTAQSRLAHGFHIYSYSYRALLDDILGCLVEDSSIEHHQFKGALFLILGDGYRSLVTKRSWEVIIKVWPKLVSAQHSEKPSILRLVDNIIDKLHKSIETAEISIVAHDKLLETARLVWTTPSNPLPALPELSQAEKERGLEEETTRNELWLQTFLQLLDMIAEKAESGQLMWKFHQIALEMVSLIIRHDVPVPQRIVNLFVSNVNHDSLNVRKICLATLSAIVKSQKREHPKVEIDPYKLSGTEPPSDSNVCYPGYGPNNEWLLYHAAEVPDTKEKWESCTFVEKTHWGYYCWPKHMYAYAPSKDQPKLDRSLEELPDNEVPIYKFFTTQESVDKLIKFLSLEENKGKDKFRSKNFTLFKGLFRNFGDSFVPLLRPHVERLVADTAHDTHECSQRCAAEIISGVIRGSKHWPWEKVQTMWEWLLPALRTGMANMTVDSVADWGTCYATASESRDPKKLAPMLKLLTENQLSGEGGSFGDSSRLYLLQGAIAQQEWRIPEILHQVLETLSPHLSHTYKNVRDRLSSVLVNLFLYDNKLPNSPPTISPQRKDYTARVLPQLELLRDTALSNGVGGAVGGTNTDQDKPATTEKALSEPEAMQITRDGSKPDSTAVSIEDVEMKCLDIKSSEENGTENGESEERKVAVRLCKTVLKWLQGSISRMFQTVTPDTYKFLPIICVLESESTDDELKRECLVAVACMAQALLDETLIPIALATAREVSKMTSWHARAGVLGYLQVVVFCNLFLMLEPEKVRQVQDLVVELICDDQLEVREMATITLSGFLQCGYLTMNDDMMKYFEKLSSTKIRKKKKLQQHPAGTVMMNPELLIKRHAGVLGLSACVQAFPYDVPGFIPQILMDLSDHLDDPQPIQMTVRKTLSNFKRTHLDNWQDHKLKFTDDQLVVLTDMLVSPNYYA